MARKFKIIHVSDKMQQSYCYALTAAMGRGFDPEFRPELTPQEMLALGVFCGKYMTDCCKEFPASWFAHARLSPSGRDCSLNYFGVDATIVRIAFVVLTIFGGAGIPVYLAGLLLIPEEGSDQSIAGSLIESLQPRSR